MNVCDFIPAVVKEQNKPKNKHTNPFPLLAPTNEKKKENLEALESSVSSTCCSSLRKDVGCYGY